MVRPAFISSIIGTIIGIIPGTGASMASWFSYDVAKICRSTRKSSDTDR